MKSIGFKSILFIWINFLFKDNPDQLLEIFWDEGITLSILWIQSNCLPCHKLIQGYPVLLMDLFFLMDLFLLHSLPFLVSPWVETRVPGGKQIWVPIDLGAKLKRFLRVAKGHFSLDLFILAFLVLNSFIFFPNIGFHLNLNCWVM